MIYGWLFGNDLKNFPQFIIKSNRQLFHASSVKRHQENKIIILKQFANYEKKYLFRHIYSSNCNISECTQRDIIKINILIYFDGL
jgi:hypothetical protein